MFDDTATKLMIALTCSEGFIFFCERPGFGLEKSRGSLIVFVKMLGTHFLGTENFD